MKKRRFIVGSLVLFFFIITGGLTSCALVENAAGTDLSNAMSMSAENGPGSGQWVPPKPQNRDQCLQLHKIGVTLKENLDTNIIQMDTVRDRCVDSKGDFLPGVDKAECALRFSEYFDAAELILVDLSTGGQRYTESCTTDEGGSTLPDWPLAEGEKDEKPEVTPVPEDPKDPEPEDTEPSWGCPPYCCLTCTQRLNTGYTLRTLDLSPSG